MITYLYWSFVVLLAVALIYLVGIKGSNWRSALIAAAVVLVVGWASHFFYFENLFVKRWGGVMTIKVPEGMNHMGVTWKDDNLWVEHYEPETNRCIFSEYSRGNLLEGKVIIEDCNPYKR